MSDGLEIKVNLGMDSNIDDIIDPDDEDKKDPEESRPNTGLE